MRLRAVGHLQVEAAKLDPAQQFEGRACGSGRRVGQAQWGGGAGHGERIGFNG
jgi:hypothetical protein